MWKKPITILAAAAVACLLGGTAQSANLKKGKKVFNKCKACHFVTKEKNKVGPHLVGIFGRKAGTVEGFKYSKAMKESGIEWSPETLAAYLKKPKKYVPGTKMVFAGLKKEKQIANLIAYLEEKSKKAD